MKFIAPLLILVLLGQGCYTPQDLVKTTKNKEKASQQETIDVEDTDVLDGTETENITNAPPTRQNSDIKGSEDNSTDLFDKKVACAGLRTDFEKNLLFGERYRDNLVEFCYSARYDTCVAVVQTYHVETSEAAYTVKDVVNNRFLDDSFPSSFPVQSPEEQQQLKSAIALASCSK